MFHWDPRDIISSELCGGNTNHARAVCRLLDEGNSIPFIARYRKGETGNLGPDQIRDAQEMYENLK